MKNYFQILGLNLDATAIDVRNAYRALAKQYHPDVNKSADAKSKIIIINEAYEVLSNPTKKARHIQQLQYQPTTTLSAEAKERLYQDWLRHQHREALKRKVAEMRRREAEEAKGFIWYFFGAFKVFGYVLLTLILLMITVLPIILFFTEPGLTPQSRMMLLLPTFMGGSFLSYFVYQSFFAGRKKR